MPVDSAQEVVAYTILGSVLGGLIVNAFHYAREHRKENTAHATWRAYLVADILHNLKEIDAIFREAGKKDVNQYRDAQLEGMLKGKDWARNGFGAGTVRLEGWQLVREPFVRTAKDPKEVVAFARMFESFQRALPSGSEDTPQVNSPGFLARPMFVLKDGFPRHGVPNNVLEVFGHGAFNMGVQLVIQYGDEEQVAEALAMSDENWPDGGWTAINPAEGWLPSSFGGVRMVVSAGAWPTKPRVAKKVAERQ